MATVVQLLRLVTITFQIAAVKFNNVIKNQSEYKKLA